MTKLHVLVDSDFHKYADDHEALCMLVALHRLQELSIIGVTTVTGNAWADMCAEHAQTALEALGQSEIPVVQGAVQPLLHRQSDFPHCAKMYGATFGGAWGKADLLESTPLSQPEPGDGQRDHAVEFIIRELRASEHPITILAIGPFTNLALAIRIAPDIVSKIERIVAMGGAFFVPGNVTPSAEFNWWFDAEAAAIVLEQDISMMVVPLDATDKIVLDHTRYSRWSKEFGNHPFFKNFHQPKFGALFEKEDAYTLPVWDALTAACLIDESLVTRSEGLWLSIDCGQGPSYGRAIGYRNTEEFNLPLPIGPQANVVLEVDEDRFWLLYESLIFGECK